MYQLKLVPDQRTQLESILRKHPRVSIQEYQQARTTANLKSFSFEWTSEPRNQDNRPWYTYIFPIVTGFSFLALVAIPIAFVLRRPLLFFLLGVSLQTVHGDRVGHFRSLFRSIIAWLPVLMFNSGILRFVSVTLSAGTYFYVGLIVLTLTGIVYAIVYPHRGLQDHIAGTVLVPA